MRAHWPAIRTQPVARLADTLLIWGKATAGMVAISLGIGALGISASIIVHLAGSYYPANAKLEAIGIVFLFAPLIALPTAVVAFPVFAVALRAGLAGWAVAIAFGALAGALAFFVLDGFELTATLAASGSVLGCIFSALFWVSGKLSNPQVLRKPTENALHAQK